jgi:hypothetical protein
MTPFDQAVAAVKAAAQDIADAGERLRRQIVAGRALAQLPRRRGRHNSSRRETTFQRACIDAGVHRSIAARWIVLGRVNDATVEQYLAGCREAGFEATAAGLRRIARQADARPVVRRPIAHDRAAFMLDALAADFNLPPHKITKTFLIEAFYERLLARRVA